MELGGVSPINPVKYKPRESVLYKESVLYNNHMYSIGSASIGNKREMYKTSLNRYSILGDFITCKDAEMNTDGNHDLKGS